MKNVQNKKKMGHLSILNKVCGTPGLLCKNGTNGKPNLVTYTGRREKEQRYIFHGVVFLDYSKL